MTRVLAYIGLGSNLDSPQQQILRAFDEIDAIAATRLRRRSRLFRTPPWGGIAQPDFVNAVAEVETGLAPRALLNELLAIERRHGRIRDGERWGPRTLDLDLLLHGAGAVREDGLELPHPRLHERAFVLVPLADIDPAIGIPGHGPVGELAATFDAQACVAL